MDSTLQHNARDTQQLVKAKEVEILYDQAKVSILAAQSAAIVFILALWGHTPANILIPWIIFFSIFNTGRYTLIMAYFKSANRNENYNIWHRRYLIGTAISGLFWGIIAILILPVEDRGYTALTILVITGLAGGSIGTYAISRPAYLSYATTSLLPLAFILLLQQESTLQTFGILVCVYYFFLSASMFRLNKMMEQVVKLQFENFDLLHQLEQEKDTIAKLNHELELDIKHHIKNEEELHDAKIKAEGLAESLSKLSIQDALTGIANRRGFDEFLANTWNRASRNKSPVSLILCDVDYFKNYNDFYGHPEGDQILKKIAQTIESLSRKGSDLVARYGGEEFAIILPDADIISAQLVAEKIRTAIQKLAIPHAKSSAGECLTISLGLASLTPHKEVDSALLLEQADQCLYSAKEAGRNRVYAKLD